jgi:hypothetical protein
VIRRITNACTWEACSSPTEGATRPSLWMKNLPADCRFKCARGPGWMARAAVRSLSGLPARTGCSRSTPGFPTKPAPGWCRWSFAGTASAGRARHPARYSRRAAGAAHRLHHRRREPGGEEPQHQRISEVQLEEVISPGSVSATIDDQPVAHLGILRTDPRPPRHELNLELPKGLSPGLTRSRSVSGPRRLLPARIVVGS